MVSFPIKNSISWVEPEKNCYPYCLVENCIDSNRNKGLNFKFWYVVKNNDRESKTDLTSHTNLKLSYLATKGNLIEIINSDLLIIDGYRICDKLLVFLRSKLNKPTTYIQHGRYTDIVHKVLSRHYFIKSKYYIKLLILSFIYNRKLTIEFLFGFFISKKIVNLSLGFIYSPIDYWKDFHNKKGFNFLETICIKDRDLTRFNLVNSNEPYILYCLQSIYEDGRVDKIIFEKFISELKRFAEDESLKLKLKLHPRSDKKYVNKLFPKYEIIDNKDIPIPLYVITHNSSIATFFSCNGVQVFCKSINTEKVPQGLCESKNIYFVNKLEEIKSIKILNNNIKFEQDNQYLTSDLFLKKIESFLSDS